MVAKRLVINEWIFSDLLNENGKERQLESIKFILLLTANDDLIGAIIGSKWFKKAQSLIGQNNPLISNISRVIQGSLIWDSNKCILLSPNEIVNLPKNLEQSVPQNDKYLAKIYLSISADVIITTDEELIYILKGNQINVIHRDDFLKDYLNR